MSSPLRRLPLGFFLMLFLPLGAVETQKATDDTYADFSKGTARGVTLTDDGFVVLAPALKKISDVSSPNLWSAVRAKDGTLFIGTGDEGHVYRVKDGKAEVWYDSEDAHVFALALNGKGELFAATSPNGKVYKIPAKDKAEVFFDLKEKNIWALSFDREDNLFVATGDKGLIYKVTPDGKGRIFYDSDEPNIIALEWDKKGNLLAGSQGTGLLYRIDPKSAEAFVLLSSGQKEIKKMALTPEGAIYAVALGAARPAAPALSKMTKLPGKASKDSHPQNAAEDEMMAMMNALPGAGDRSPDASSGKGGSSDLYLILPDGYPEKIWSSKATTHSLAVRNGNALLGTGDEGYIFEVDPRGKARTLLKLDSNQITALFPESDASGMTAAGSNLGALWKIGPDPASEGSFESEVYNSKSFSRWGNLTGRASIPEGSAVTFETRTGNTPKADKTWSAWTELKKNRIQSPAAQYFQYRMTLKGNASPKVDEVAVYSLPRNLPPRITQVNVVSTGAMPPGLLGAAGGPNMAQMAAQIGQMEMAKNAGNHPAGLPAPGNPLEMFGAPPRSTQRPSQDNMHFAYWKVTDSNQDSLEYKVQYKLAGDREWSLLAEKTATPYLAWDTSGWPDGEYTLRVLASDAPDNAPAEALSSEAESLVFVIDSTPPKLEDVSVKRPEATFTVRDAVSNVKSVTISPDGRDYNLLMPENGMFDSRTESFQYKIPKDQQRLFIRMEDEEGNVSAGKIEF